MFFQIGLCFLAAYLQLAHAGDTSLGNNSTQTAEYEYIVVGSGAGGGPLAARRALAGYKTLLIEAGDDQGTNDNYTVPAYEAKATEDPQMSWDFFVRHFRDDTQQKKDFKLTYTCPNGQEYIGLDPPTGCKIKGILYPRAATLGGCTAHNALLTIYPYRSDFEHLVDLTGDESWSPDNMRTYFKRMEDAGYAQAAVDPEGHGNAGWLGTDVAPVALAVEDLQATSQLIGASFALGNLTGIPLDLVNALAGDVNSDSDTRDSSVTHEFLIVKLSQLTRPSTPTLYQPVMATKNGTRNGSRDFIVQVRDATNADGSKKYPLDVKLDTHVTKVVFGAGSTKDTPRATGVQYLEGKYLYRAHKLADTAGKGVPGSVSASREVIISGGTYNSPQILKLSGIGPAAELNRFGIPVIKDLPGVGTNLQDHYEISVQSVFSSNFSILDGCTFGLYGAPDPCLDQWKAAPPAGVGYDSSGFAVCAFLKSSAATDDNFDVFAFGGPNNFRGYFPNYSVNATIEHNWWTWALLKSHPRNKAGSVTLRSADPLDVPYVDFEFFQDGADEDLEALYESIAFARSAFARQPYPQQEALPGIGVQSREDLFEYIKNDAWSHHCSSTCAIGTDDDPMAVLDSKFRVRGVQSLRVVDASVYPRIPGTFTALSTYLVGEKAADEIIADAIATSV